MTTKYTYQLTSFPNQKFNFDRLQYEIEHSLINTSLDYAAGLNGDGGTGVAINFKTSLSDAEKTTLDAIVTTHTGEPLTPVPAKTEIAQVDNQGNVVVAIQPRTGTGVTLITHNFADPKSWYSNATRVVDDILTTSGSVYTTYDFNAELIDMENGRVTFENTKTNSAYGNETYLPKIKVNGNLVTNGYHINYITNQVIFDTPLTGSDIVSSTYYKINDSTFTIAPLPGKQLVMEHVEVQFSTNVDFTDKELWFDIWAYNPYDPTGPKVRAQSPVIYKNVKDYINESNNTLSTTVPAIGELTHPCYIFAWQYPAARVIKASQGAEIRLFVFDPKTGSKSNLFKSLDGQPIEVATGTFYCLSEPEV